MRKTMLILFLVITICVSSTTSAFAASQAVNVTPSLSFVGTTAHCDLSIYKPGKTIDATMELWYGNTRISGWHRTVTSYLVINGTATVVSGRTYTLKVSGTIGGVAFNGISVTGTC